MDTLSRRNRCQNQPLPPVDYRLYQSNAYLGFGKYGLNWPINLNMLVLLTSPTIGRAVSNGVLATKDLEAPKGAGFDSAKNGVRPVAVGPGGSSQHIS